MIKNFLFLITLATLFHIQCNQLDIDLRFYCTLGLLDKVQDCVNKGAHIDSRDGIGRTALQIAKSCNYVKIVTYLTSIGG